MAKQEKTSVPKTTKPGIPVHGLAGLAILFVVVSIGYANYVVYFGTHDLVSKIMLIPSTVFALSFLVYKAAK